MWLFSLRRWIAGKSRSPQTRLARSQRPRFVPRLDYLEERIVPSTLLNVDAGDVNNPSPPSGDYSLVGAINQANTDSQHGIADTIQLAGGTYTVTAANNTTNGANALPVITATSLTIESTTGATIERSSFANGYQTPAFRLLDVGSGANVTLQNLTLSGGQATGATAQGGAIYDAGGNLTLKTVAVQSNVASASGQTANGAGNNAQGGGLYVSGGVVNLTNSSISDNSLFAASGVAGSAGGNAQGGSIYATNGATLVIHGGSLSVNTLYAGDGGTGTANKPTGGNGGDAQGGGIYARGGSVTLTGGVVASTNTINGGYGGRGSTSGSGGQGGNAEGGGVYVSNTGTTNSVAVGGNAVIKDNTLNVGVGGTGETGGQGGNGGQGLGGGLYVQGGTVSVTGAGTEIDANTINGGAGGTGGAAGASGGAGGAVAGGGLYVRNAPLTYTEGTTIAEAPSASPRTSPFPGIAGNTIFAGKGGNGGQNTLGVGGVGGSGGIAQGGGVFVSGSGQNVTLGNGRDSDSAGIQANGATAGNGGSGGKGAVAGTGGAGGLASGGGLSILGDTLAMDNTTVYANDAIGGKGGVGATSAHGGVLGNYGSGGNALGGGLFVSGSSGATVLNSAVFDNSASAGIGAAGGNAVGAAKYGLGGTAEGGGLYATNSTANVLNSTFANNLLAAGTNAGTSLSGLHVSGGGTAQGGGLYAANGTLALTNDTVAWNYLVAYTDRGAIAGQGGGVYNGPSDNLSLENTIIALDEIFSNSKSGESNGTYNDFAGTAATMNDDNLIGNSSTDANFAPGGSQQLFAVPTTNNTLLGYTLSGQVPGNYGGLTYTLPLNWSTSPAISTGDATAVSAIASAEGVDPTQATDARGLPRVLDSTIDQGATETQVILSNIASPTSVQAGGTITYTLTVTNNEASSVNVTLSDVVPANTTYQSSSGTGWTITAPSSSNGNTLSATASLAANSTATLTLTVVVNSNVPAGTSISNTATITPTGNTAAGGRSAGATTSVSGSSTTNITSKVGLVRSPVLHNPFSQTSPYVQGALLVNNSGATLTGPVALVLVGLPSDVTLTNASGTYNGSPYINIVPTGGSWQAGLWHFLVTVLEFNTSNPADIHYTPEIVQGI